MPLSSDFLLCGLARRYWQPHVTAWVNHVRTAAYASVTWCCGLWLIIAFNIRESAPLHSTLRTSAVAKVGPRGH